MTETWFGGLDCQREGEMRGLHVTHHTGGNPIEDSSGYEIVVALTNFGIADLHWRRRFWVLNQSFEVPFKRLDQKKCSIRTPSRTMPNKSTGDELWPSKSFSQTGKWLWISPAQKDRGSRGTQLMERTQLRANDNHARQRERGQRRVGPQTDSTQRHGIGTRVISSRDNSGVKGGGTLGSRETSA